MAAPSEFRTASSLQRADIPQESERVAGSANPENPGKDRVAAVAVDKIHICGSCEREGAKSRCSICKVVYYCNKDCQTGHWKIHKTVCPVMAALAPTSRECSNAAAASRKDKIEFDTLPPSHTDFADCATRADSLPFQGMEKAIFELQVLASKVYRYVLEVQSLLISWGKNSAYSDRTQIDSAEKKMKESGKLFNEKACTIGLQSGVSQLTLDRIKEFYGNYGIVTFITIGQKIKKKNCEIRYDHISDIIIVLNSSKLESSEIRKIIHNQSYKYQVIFPVVETDRNANGNIQIMLSKRRSDYYKEVLTFLEEEGSGAQRVAELREALRKAEIEDVKYDQLRSKLDELENIENTREH